MRTVNSIQITAARGTFRLNNVEVGIEPTEHIQISLINELHCYRFKWLYVFSLMKKC